MATDLNDVLGALVASVAHARRIADEQSAEIAEYYREHPVLGGMSIPRVRLPQVTVDLPVVIDTFQSGGGGKVATPGAVNDAVRTALKATVSARGGRIPTGLLTDFRTAFATAVGDTPAVSKATAVYGQAAERALIDIAHNDKYRRFLDADTVANLKEALRRAAEEASVDRPASRSQVAVSVLTSDVKEAPSESVAHIRFTMNEEGMEWTRIDNADGTTSRRLIPE